MFPSVWSTVGGGSGWQKLLSPLKDEKDTYKTFVRKRS